MIVLDSNTRSLEVVLGAPQATAPLPCVATYTDYDQATLAVLGTATLAGLTAGTTAATVVPAPFGGNGRKLRQLIVQNADSVAQAATVRTNDNGVTTAHVAVTLQPGDHLHYVEGDTFRVYDSTGKERVQSAGMPADPLPPAHGGTGLSTLTAHGVLVGEGTGNVAGVTMTDGQLLAGQTGADPQAVAMSGDATFSKTGALTLAAVNANVGTFTNATITLNAKGLATAASSGSAGTGPALYTGTATTTVTATTDTSLLPSTGSGSTTLGANYLTAGKTVRVRAMGVYTSTGAAVGLTFKLKLGGSVIASLTFGNPPLTTNAFWRFEAELVCYTTGSSGTAWTQALFTANQTETGGPNSAAATVNTTTTNALDLTAAWGNTGQSVTLTNLTIEGLN